jgi:serine/threonine protein phosphatase 1
MSKKFCIGDIHGCSNTLNNLLSTIKLSKQDSLVFVGDYIDRGPDSKGVIDIILDLQKKNYDVTCLLGNHEDLFIESNEDDEIYVHWIKNCGGFQTLKSFDVATYSELGEQYKYFFKSLLHYKIVNKKNIIVHAGINFNNKDIFEDKYALLWERNTQIDFDKLNNRIIVHGHTPQPIDQTLEQIKNINTSKIINIDSGCVFKNNKNLGLLTCIELNTLNLITEKNIYD